MPHLIFDLVDVTGASSRYDSITVRASNVRASMTTPGVVTTRGVHVPAPTGTEDVWVEPGPFDVTVRSGSRKETLRLTAPDVERVNLSDLLGREQHIAPTEVDRIWASIRQLETQGGTVEVGDQVVRFESLTPAQIKQLRGPQGPPGPPGERGADGKNTGDTYVTNTYSLVPDWVGDGPVTDTTKPLGSQPGQTYLDRLTGNLYRL